MSTPVNADLAVLASVTHHLAISLAGIDDQQWALPTPCANWDLRALVDHVTGGNWFTVAILDGATSDAALSEARRRFGDASPSTTQMIRAAARQLDAFQKPRALSRSWDHVAGRLVGSEILRLRLHDLIVHAWDIDRTLSTTARLPLDLAHWGVTELALNSLGSIHFGLVDLDLGHDDGRPDIAYLRAFGREPLE
ncbi:MAG: TIGR03086 family metal-binding protein [Ilumatobacter sp.]|uniref:TIGR03086 family metal-binding protein n=1 Tax=Ilumatobacter sp. TaxID=1967498 RepID=UPI003C71A79C